MDLRRLLGFSTSETLPSVPRVFLNSVAQVNGNNLWRGYFLVGQRVGNKKL